MFSVCIELNHDPDFQHYIYFFFLLIFYRRVSVAAIVVFGSFDFVKVNQCSHLSGVRCHHHCCQHYHHCHCHLRTTLLTTFAVKLLNSLY